MEAAVIGGSVECFALLWRMDACGGGFTSAIQAIACFSMLRSLALEHNRDSMYAHLLELESTYRGDSVTCVNDFNHNDNLRMLKSCICRNMIESTAGVLKAVLCVLDLPGTTCRSDMLQLLDFCTALGYNDASKLLLKALLHNRAASHWHSSLCLSLERMTIKTFWELVQYVFQYQAKYKFQVDKKLMKKGKSQLGMELSEGTRIEYLSGNSRIGNHADIGGNDDHSSFSDFPKKSRVLFLKSKDRVKMVKSNK